MSPKKGNFSRTTNMMSFSAFTNMRSLSVRRMNSEMTIQQRFSSKSFWAYWAGKGGRVRVLRMSDGHVKTEIVFTNKSTVTFAAFVNIRFDGQVCELDMALIFFSHPKLLVTGVAGELKFIGHTCTLWHIQRFIFQVICWVVDVFSLGLVWIDQLYTLVILELLTAVELH